MNDILKQQHSLANDNVKQIFSTFVTWFTFFWTLNIAALGLLYAPATIIAISGRYAFSVGFLALNILGLGVCHFCRKSTSRLLKEAKFAADSWIKAVEATATVPSGIQISNSTGLFPTNFLCYVFFASAISLCLNIVGWISVLVISCSTAPK